MKTEPDVTGKRIVITGGAGFVGSHLAELLVAKGAQVTVLDNLLRGKKENLSLVADRVNIVQGDVRKREDLATTFKGADYVFHEAALWLKKCAESPRECLEVNVDGTFNVLDAAREAGVKKVVFASSASVYGNPVSIPMTEEHPLQPLTHYCASKAAGEYFC